MSTPNLTTNAAREAGQTTPKYSEQGPVWVAKSYETTDECADSSRTTWMVCDLDDNYIALDLSESGARDVARALNGERRLRLLAVSAQSLYWWAHEAWETVHAQTCHDPEDLAPSWLPELKVVLDEFYAVNRELEGAS